MNQKRYWLRGGIIMVMLWIVINVATYFSQTVRFLVPLDLFDLPINALIFIINPYLPKVPFLYIFHGAYYFAIGALLGWLYGKVKNRNKLI